MINSHSRPNHSQYNTLMTAAKFIIPWPRDFESERQIRSIVHPGIRGQ